MLKTEGGFSWEWWREWVTTYLKEEDGLQVKGVNGRGFLRSYRHVSTLLINTCERAASPGLQVAPYHLEHLDEKFYARTYTSYLPLYVVVLALKQ